ncbi:unnamed protein product, partial [Owenia fusiformis]
CIRELHDVVAIGWGVVCSLVVTSTIGFLSCWVYKLRKENKRLKKNDYSLDNRTHIMVDMNASDIQSQSVEYEEVQPIFDTGSQVHENDVQNLNTRVREYPMEVIDIGATLGAGEFGVVKLVNVSDPRYAPFTAAAKILMDNASDDDHQSLLRELDLMKQLPRHDNVIELLGFSKYNEHTMILVEHLALGDLHSYLRANKAKYIRADMLDTSKEFLQFGLQIAKGMNHISINKFLHRDLATRNVLLSASKICKISDFGLSRDVGEKDLYSRKSQGRLPIRWMSPEALFHNIYTTKNDVWAYGILLWEIVTFGSTPYSGMNGKAVMRLVKSGKVMDRPQHCKSELYNVMVECWSQDAATRPQFSDIVSKMEGILEQETPYLRMSAFKEHLYVNVTNTKSLQEKL